jgi:pyridinium-3,5-bisthiocarboxylic acid mononucleotide nickel chelatase
MILWLNPVSGVPGDMLLAALLDLGAPIDAVRAAVAGTGIEGWQPAWAWRRRGPRRKIQRLSLRDQVHFLP